MSAAYNFYQDVAQTFNAYNNCIKSGNKEWEDRHANNLEDLVKKYLPRGSGFDNGTKFNWDESKDNKLVFDTAFHHMDENGYYDGWSEHKIIITPDLVNDFNVKITGKNRNNIKEYINSCFSDFAF
jgi:hypothetical protein